jgi:hypothetical protein
MHGLTKRIKAMSGTNKPMLCATMCCIAISGNGSEAKRLNQGPIYSIDP